jgi:hypothetical protein
VPNVILANVIFIGIHRYNNAITVGRLAYLAQRAKSFIIVRATVIQTLDRLARMISIVEIWLATLGRLIPRPRLRLLLRRRCCVCHSATMVYLCPFPGHVRLTQLSMACPTSNTSLPHLPSISSLYVPAALPLTWLKSTSRFNILDQERKKKRKLWEGPNVGMEM